MEQLYVYTCGVSCLAKSETSQSTTHLTDCASMVRFSCKKFLTTEKKSDNVFGSSRRIGKARASSFTCAHRIDSELGRAGGQGRAGRAGQGSAGQGRAGQGKGRHVSAYVMAVIGRQNRVLNLMNHPAMLLS